MTGKRGFFGSLFGRGEKEERQAAAGPGRPTPLTRCPPGTLIADRYEVVKTLAGGMGVVSLCLDRLENHPVALKTFRPEYLPHRAARDRFLREGTIWVELGRHPHVVRCDHVFSIPVGQEVYLVLEWIAEAEGKRDASLRAWLTPGRPLPVEQALLFALHIVRGMKHATAKRPDLVHRDLKPENVLVGREGYARVTDFGLAHVLQAEDEMAIGVDRDDEEDGRSPLRHSRLTRGVGVGTPEYMAPEQWEQRDIDRRADIYAMGCILVELLTTQMPVRAMPREACYALHQSGQALKAARGLPDGIQPLLTRCLAVHPDERYRDWAEVEEALVNAYRAATGHDAPVELARADETRAERVEAGWSYNALGGSYLNISKFDVAITYFERVLRIGQAEEERSLEGAALGNLGTAYRNLGEPRRAIGFYEQRLAIAREIGDVMGVAIASFNLASLLASQGQRAEALRHAEYAAQVFVEVGHTQYAQQAQQLLAQLRGQRL